MSDRDDKATELRTMVLDYALALARQCVAQTREVALSAGEVEDTLSAGDTEWHLHVLYTREGELVRVEGHIHVGHEGLQVFETMQDFHDFMKVAFGADKDRFDFVLPAAWVVPVEVPS